MQLGRWLFVLPVVFLLGSALTLLGAADYPNAQLLIETSELESILSRPGVRLLDARPREEYCVGHLPGAVNFPAPATDDLDFNRQGFPLNPDRAPQMFQAAGINSGSGVIVYDDQGNRFSARVFYVLEFFGHPRVQVLNGGFAKWQREGRPVTAEEPNVAAGDFKPSINSNVIATAAWLAGHLKDPGVKLVDARSAAEFSGDMGQGSGGGHIPGAINIEWTRAIESGAVKTFLPAAQLEQLFSDAQVTRDREVVAYCQMGMRAAQIYFALRLLGYPHVRVYDGSWAEWSANPALPVEK